MRDTPFDVPVIVSVAFDGGAEAPPHAPTSMQVARHTTSPTGTARRSSCLFPLPLLSDSASAKIKVSASTPNATGKLRIPGARPGRIITLEVFDSVTTKVMALEPLTVTEAGETEHIADVGAPVQLRDMVPANPLLGVTCRL